MQCVALALFHSSPSLKKMEPLKRNSYLRFLPRFHPPSSSTSSPDLLTSISHGVYPCIRSLNLFLSTSRLARFSALSLFFNRTPDPFEVRAASIPGNSSDPAKSTGSIRRLQLGAMFAIWYLLNVYFNIYNKQVLKVYPFPATFTAFQFGCGTAIAALIWAFNLHPRPRITASQLAVILPLALAHTAGNLLTNVSIGKVAVSFTHTIKAMEPFFTVVFAAIFLGEKPTPFVVSSLLPVVSGVALASFSEASFNWSGFCCAMASNLTNQSRNVLSKKFMVKKEALDNVNLFSIITSLSFALAVPMAIFMEGIKFSPTYLQSLASRGLDVRALCIRSLLVGICFHSYQQISYMILQMVSPVTHSVGNCVKRVVIIVSSIIFFHTPFSPINFLGTMLALGGVLLYSKAKQMKSKPKLT